MAGTQSSSKPNPNTNRKKHNQRTGGGRQSRLQKQAPAALKVTPVSSRCVQDWKVAIPLLTPLILSPASPNQDPTVGVVDESSPTDSATSSFSFTDEDEMQSNGGDNQGRQIEEKTPSFVTWQHPAAPFFYDSSPLMTSFVHHCR